MKSSFLLLLMVIHLTGCSTSNWWSANRDSAGIAPKPEDLTESIVQIYGARTWGWRGYFGIHPWIAWKKKEDKEYSVAQVSAWSLRTYGSSVRVDQDIPDRFWYDNQPNLYFEARGEKADRIISKLDRIIREYPYHNTYDIWPGPNSNTFIEHIIRNSSEITVELPPHAVGKDFLTNSRVFAKSPTGTGFQFSILGLFGFTLGLAEGIEINILSMTFGVDILRPALKLPFIGRVGLKDKPL